MIIIANKILRAILKILRLSANNEFKLPILKYACFKDSYIIATDNKIIVKIIPGTKYPPLPTLFVDDNAIRKSARFGGGITGFKQKGKKWVILTNKEEIKIDEPPNKKPDFSSVYDNTKRRLEQIQKKKGTFSVTISSTYLKLIGDLAVKLNNKKGTGVTLTFVKGNPLAPIEFNIDMIPKEKSQAAVGMIMPMKKST